MPRPKGLPKTGGRKAGAANQKTREIAEIAFQTGITPLEVMLQIMQTALVNKEMDKALDAAKSAAPYMHPRLQAIEQSGPDGGPIETRTSIEVSFVTASDEAEDAD
jgi:hypothetical protein